MYPHLAQVYFYLYLFKPLQLSIFIIATHPHGVLYHGRLGFYTKGIGTQFGLITFIFAFTGSITQLQLPAGLVGQDKDTKLEMDMNWPLRMGWAELIVTVLTVCACPSLAASWSR